MTRLLQIACVLLLALSAAKAVADVSEKAQRFFNRGTAAIKAAESPQDFKDAAEEFNKASAAAPSWPDPYYNAGVALEKAGDPAGAYKAFKSYLKAAPNAPDAKHVQKKVDELEYLAEKKAKARAQDGGSEEDFQSLLQSLDGYIYDGDKAPCATYQIRIDNGSATWGAYFCDDGTGSAVGWTPLSKTHKLTGYTSSFGLNSCIPSDVSSQRPSTIIVSPDGKTLTQKVVCNGKEKVLDVFKLR